MSIAAWPLHLKVNVGTGAVAGLRLLAPHLTAENHERVLAAAGHKSKREVEELVAALRPQPAVPSSVRKLPVPKSPATPIALETPQVREPTPRPMMSVAMNAELAQPIRETREHVAEVRPLAPERYKVQFTVSRETHDRLREAQNLLRHSVPDGDVGAIFERALKLLLADLHKTRHALVDRPRAASLGTTGRHIAASVKRAVWERDNGQCAFVSAAGRCTERGFLEYHHVVPYADGGAPSAGNLQLRCRAHNAYESARWFGLSEEDLVREAGAAYSVRTELGDRRRRERRWRRKIANRGRHGVTSFARASAGAP